MAIVSLLSIGLIIRGDLISIFFCACLFYLNFLDNKWAVYWFHPLARGGEGRWRVWLSLFKTSFESFGEKVSFDRTVDLFLGEELLLFCYTAIIYLRSGCFSSSIFFSSDDFSNIAGILFSFLNLFRSAEIALKWSLGMTGTTLGEVFKVLVSLKSLFRRLCKS